MRLVAWANRAVAGGFAALGVAHVVAHAARPFGSLGLFAVVALYYAGLGWGALELRAAPGRRATTWWPAALLLAHATTGLVGVLLFAFDAFGTWPLGRSYERWATPVFDWGLILAGVPATLAALPYRFRAPLIVVGFLGPAALGLAFAFAVAGAAQV